MTNSAGEFTITPELHSDANQFEVRATADYDHFFEAGTGFDRSTINSSVVEASLRVTRKGWIVVTFSDVIDPDSGDWFGRYEASWKDGCTAFQTMSANTRTPLDESYSEWQGIISNGRAWNDAPGNDSVTIRFTKWKRRTASPAVTFYKTVYCPAGDSAFLHVDY